MASTLFIFCYSISSGDATNVNTFKSSAALFLPRMVAGLFALLPTESCWSLLLVLPRCSSAHSQLSVQSRGMGFLWRYVASNVLSPLLSLNFSRLSTFAWPGSGALLNRDLEEALYKF